MAEKKWWEKAAEERRQKDDQRRKDDADRRGRNFLHNSIFEQERKDGSRGFGYRDNYD